MALQDHLRLAVLIDGVYLVELVQAQVNGDSGNQPVRTLEGLVGKTPGSRELNITFNSAVPIGGLEVDFLTYCADGSYHQVQIPVGSKTIVSDGWFQTAGLGGGVNANTEGHGEFHGTFDPPK